MSSPSDGSPQPSAAETLALGARSNRPQSLLISVFGVYVGQVENWMPVPGVLRLLADLGIGEPATRSALSRLKRKRVLAAAPREGVAGYEFTPAALRERDANDAGIYGRRHPPQHEGWVLAAFSVPESARNDRYKLRASLAHIGFARVDGGLWIAPAPLRDRLHRLIKSLDLTDNVSMFTAEYDPSEETKEAVHVWWDLDTIAATYESFIELYRPLRTRMRRRRHPPTPEQAFSDYVPLLTAWRALPASDPGLPAEYLPKNWAGFRAADLFYELHDALAEPSLRHISEGVRAAT